MDHNLKKEEKQFIALIIGFIAVIIFGLIAMFISQFGGLEALTPVHFAVGFIKAGIVFLYAFCVPLIWKRTQAETDQKVGNQRLDNDSVRRECVDNIQIWCI